MDSKAMELLQEAARVRRMFQMRREEEHERVRRYHRLVALAGGGERECLRRREQMAKGMR